MCSHYTPVFLGQKRSSRSPRGDVDDRRRRERKRRGLHVRLFFHWTYVRSVIADKKIKKCPRYVCEGRLLRSARSKRRTAAPGYSVSPISSVSSVAVNKKTSRSAVTSRGVRYYAHIRNVRIVFFMRTSRTLLRACAWSGRVGAESTRHAVVIRFAVRTEEIVSVRIVSDRTVCTRKTITNRRRKAFWGLGSVVCDRVVNELELFPFDFADRSVLTVLPGDVFPISFPGCAPGLMCGSTRVVQFLKQNLQF